MDRLIRCSLLGSPTLDDQSGFGLPEFFHLLPHEKPKTIEDRSLDPNIHTVHVTCIALVQKTSRLVLGKMNSTASDESRCLGRIFLASQPNAMGSQPSRYHQLSLANTCLFPIDVLGTTTTNNNNNSNNNKSKNNYYYY